MPTVIISVLLAALLGSSVSFVAEAAQPGDALYPFKVGVLEKVEERFAVSDQAKINLHIEDMNARLTEGAALAQNGLLTQEIQSGLIQNFSQHAQAVSVAIADLEEKGQHVAAANLALAFQTTLAQEKVQLADMRTKSSTKTQVAFAPILTAVQNALTDASTVSAAAAAKAAAVE